MNDDTRSVQMVHPDGSIVPIMVSPRHNGGRAVEYYRAKGFMTVDEHAREQARQKEVDDLRAENERLKAGKRGA